MMGTVLVHELATHVGGTPMYYGIPKMWSCPLVTMSLCSYYCNVNDPRGGLPLGSRN